MRNSAVLQLHNESRSMLQRKLLYSFTFWWEVTDFSETLVSSSQIIQYNIFEDIRVRTVTLMYGAHKTQGQPQENCTYARNNCDGKKMCRTEPLITTFLQEEVCVIKFTLRMVRDNITYHKRVRAANSAPSIINFENKGRYKQHGNFIRPYFTRNGNRINMCFHVYPFRNNKKQQK